MECGEDHILGSQPQDCFACLAEHRDRLLAALRIAQPEFCSLKCPSVFRTPDSKRHIPACVEMQAAIVEADCEGTGVMGGASATAPMPTIVDLFDVALNGANNAMPVLIAMLKTANLKGGLVVADEVWGNVKCALKVYGEQRDLILAAVRASAPAQGEIARLALMVEVRNAQLAELRASAPALGPTSDAEEEAAT
jgi:hypothetical protein